MAFRERQLLGEVEQLVLLAILRLGDATSRRSGAAYAVPIREEIRRHGGIQLPFQRIAEVQAGRGQKRPRRSAKSPVLWIRCCRRTTSSRSARPSIASSPSSGCSRV